MLLSPHKGKQKLNKKPPSLHYFQMVIKGSSSIHVHFSKRGAGDWRILRLNDSNCHHVKSYYLKKKLVLMHFGDGLRLPDEPLESLVSSLALQFCPDHLPAFPVVIVHPVALFLCQ